MSGANTVLKGVLLDTSFVIRLLRTNDVLHPNAKAWFRQLLERRVPMYLSTISIAEYCVKGSFDELPLRNVRVLPFNIDHARRAGPFTGSLLDQRKQAGSEDDRAVVISDVKLLAQAEVDVGISHFLTKDLRFPSRMQALRQGGHVLRTAVLDLNIPMAESLGVLDFLE
jgi:predicted nucleic acid-binding protein